MSTRTYLLKNGDYSAGPVEASPSTSGGPTTPFVTSYPIITARDNNNEKFKGQAGFYIKYIIKTHPQTRGDYKFEVRPPVDAAVCKITVTHIGDNMPCAEPPGPSLTGYENTIIDYVVTPNVETDAHEVGKPAAITFRVSCCSLLSTGGSFPDLYLRA